MRASACPHQQHSTLITRSRIIIIMVTIRSETHTSASGSHPGITTTKHRLLSIISCCYQESPPQDGSGRQESSQQSTSHSGPVLFFFRHSTIESFYENPTSSRHFNRGLDTSHVSHSQHHRHTTLKYLFRLCKDVYILVLSIL